MQDVITRALRNPFDYLPVIQRRTLTHKETIQESDEIYSFVFTTKKPCVWKAGQHGIFLFPRTKMQGKSWRAFSICSSAQEGVIRFSTIIKEQPSDFKKKLLSLTPGEEIVMHGPFGEFHTSHNITRIVGIAGGIGITPFRPLIKDIVSGVIPETYLTLIYSSLGPYTFKDELDLLAKHPHIEIIYTQTPDEVNAALALQVQEKGNAANYFISGSPGMIGAIRASLREKGIKHIVNDPFRGY